MLKPATRSFSNGKKSLGEKYLIIGFKRWDEAFKWLESVDFQVDAIATEMIYPHHVVLRILQLIRSRIIQNPASIYHLFQEQNGKTCRRSTETWS